MWTDSKIIRIWGVGWPICLIWMANWTRSLVGNYVSPTTKMTSSLLGMILGSNPSRPAFKLWFNFGSFIVFYHPTITCDHIRFHQNFLFQFGVSFRLILFFPMVWWFSREFVRNVRAIRILTPAEVFYYTNEEKWTAATYNSNGGGAPKLL